MNVPSAALLRTAAARWGTPLYVTDLDAAVRNLAALRAALPASLVAFAIKANPDPQLVRRLVAEGAGAEVVNAVELAIADRAGCPPERIVMNGIGKTDDDLRAAFAAGALVNVESLDELRSALAASAGAPAPSARIGLRLNPALDAATHPHLATGAAGAKFGIAWPDLDLAIAILRDAGREPASIGAHIGSDVGAIDAFAMLAGRLAAAAARTASGAAIDLGGGLADLAPARLAAYAAAVRDALPTHRLILEPGRSIVADAGWLVTRILRVQQRDALVHLVADAGMTELLRPMLYGAEHPVGMLEPGEGLDPGRRAVALSGPVCEAGDVLIADLGRTLSAEDLARSGHGALLAIGRAGAYGVAMASNYNGRLRPAQAVIDHGELRLSVRRETLDDLALRWT